MKRNCLDRSELQLVLSGRLGPDDFEAALSHLDSCESCRTSAETFQQDEPWLVESLGGASDPLQAETDCQIALWNVLEESGPAKEANNDHVSAPPLETLGPYKLQRALGSGGMGTVYLAEHVRLKRPCAIKMLPRDRVDQPGWLERFDREMITVASLEHPHVVGATDAGHQDGWHYLVMEYLDGLDVGRVASRLGQLEVADACEIVRQAALGLSHVHASGLVHRDVKPSNLMLTRDGNVKLLDLGLVLSGDDPLSVSDRLTTVGHLMGTMPYMAPEQLIDSRDVSSAADIYALGATLYRLIAGRPPHPQHGGLAKQVMAITEQDAPPLDSVREDIEKGLVHLVSTMLSRNPESRPRDSEEVAVALKAFTNGHQLKRLLRHAKQKPDRDVSLPSNLTLAASGEPPKEGFWRRRRSLLLTTFAAALILLAGTLIKIETDRGELQIHSERDGVVVSISQGKKVVEQLELKSGPNNRITLRKGTYRIVIDGANDGLALSSDVVTVQRGSSETVDLKPKSSLRVYQGKSLEQWMDLLDREEDPVSLGRIMKAVEVLTRETDVRASAADATLRTARIWGGFSSSAPNNGPNSFSNPNSSQVYMHFLMDVFPKYGEQGLHAIDVELDQGNTSSRLAAIWLLSRIVEINGPMPTGMIDHLGKTVRKIETSSLPHANMTETGKSTGVRLLMKQRGNIIDHPWLADYVRKAVANSETIWKKAAPANLGYESSTPWILPEYMLMAARDLESAGQLKLNMDWLASILIGKYYRRLTKQTDELFDWVAKRDVDALLKHIDAGLESMTVPVIEQNHFWQNQSPDGFPGGSQWIPAFALCSQESIWPKALPYYSAQIANPAQALRRLKQLKEVIIRQGVDPEQLADRFKVLDAAIAKLESRSS